MYVVGDERWNVMGVCAVCRPGIFRAWGLSLRARMYVCMRYEVALPCKMHHEYRPGGDGCATIT